MYFIGIDPGKTGAISIINRDRQIVEVIDYDGNPQRVWQKLEEMRDLSEFTQPLYGAIENLNDHGGIKVTEMLKHAGIQEGFLIALYASYERVTATRWKSHIPADLRAKRPVKPEGLKRGGVAPAPAFEDDEEDSFQETLKGHERRLQAYEKKMKTAARLACQRFFPTHAHLFNRSMDEHRAEATLIAMWCRTQIIMEPNDKGR